MKLNINLLKDDNLAKYSEDYKSCYNARGLYDSMQFVLRLRPDLHAKLDQTSIGVHPFDMYDFETVQACSTYLHETIHWWQHIGSISGLVISLSYPAQAHINFNHLKEYIKLTGLVKPIVRYNQLHATEFEPNDDEFKTINRILNNFHDIQFFKYLVINPKSAESVINNEFFESVGHSYHVAYSSFINLLSSTFDPELEFLPKADNWHVGFEGLNEKKFAGYFYGSPVNLPPIGLIDIFEGQARFSQIQYLYFASGGKLIWDDFEKLGMLSDVYYSAFTSFLELTESERPDEIGSPLVALFLLILDLSMNPTDGFPFDITHYESFIASVDPGIRFMFLCRTVALIHPEFKYFIKDYSSSEYFVVADKLSKAILCPSPIDSAAYICEWSRSKKPLIELMKEEKNFSFNKVNQPIRLIFSRFIRYQEDKLKNPAYFCWPGIYSAGDKCSDESLRLFLEHQSLFVDKADGDIYPRTFPDKDESSVHKAFEIFYSWVVTYDLCRQWIVDEGEFDYDYLWLTSKYSMDELKKWSANHFKMAYGVDTKDFKILGDTKNALHG